MAHAPKPKINAKKGTAEYKAQVKARRAWHKAHGGIKVRKKKKKATNDNVEIANLEQYILSQNIES